MVGPRWFAVFGILLRLHGATPSIINEHHSNPSSLLSRHGCSKGMHWFVSIYPSCPPAHMAFAGLVCGCKVWLSTRVIMWRAKYHCVFCGMGNGFGTCSSRYNRFVWYYRQRQSVRCVSKHWEHDYLSMYTNNCTVRLAYNGM